MQKEKTLRTYGRHKNRVVVADIWLCNDGNSKGQQGVFATSEDSSGVFQSSSGSSGALSLNSTGNSNHSNQSLFSNRVQTRSTRKLKQGANKENEAPRNCKKETKSKRQIWDISSADSSRQSEKSKRTTKALRDRNRKVDYNDSADLKKQLRGTTAKRKRPVRVTKTDGQREELSVNFSDFDNYSLVISDSPPVQNDAITKRLSLETSTPVAKRTRHKNVSGEKMKVGDISHIEMVPSPGSGLSFASAGSPESHHSDSLYSSPSVISSVYSEDISNWSDNKALTGPKKPSGIPLVQLQRIKMDSATDYLLNSQKHNSLEKRTRNGSNVRFNNSESLFNSPDNDICRNVSLLTEQLRKAMKKQRYCESLNNETEPNESVEDTEDDEESEDDGSDGGEESENDEAEESEDDEEETDPEESEEEDQSDLSAIHEVEETSETETSQNVMDGDILESCEISGENIRVTKNREKKLSPTVNLERLSESLLTNHVNRRKTRHRKAKHKHDDDDDVDMDKLADCLEQSNINSTNSDVSLYMLNDLHASKEKSAGSEKLDDSTESLEDIDSDCSGSDVPYHETDEKKSRTIKLRLSGKESDLDDDLTESLEMSHIESSGSNCTLYMLNKDNGEKVLTNEMSNLSIAEVEEDSIEDVSGEEEGLMSDAVKIDGQNETEYSTEDEEEEEEPDDADNHEFKTPPKKYRLRDRLQDIQSSFSEILTPERRKSSLIPLSAEARVLLLCDQAKPVTFREALSRKMLSKCKKIGEGVYGEVFRSHREDGDAVAIKIIPIEGDFEVNDEPQKKFDEILPEIVIAKELSDLRNQGNNMSSNFCQVHSVSCVRGKYPAELIKQWDIYDKNKRSENDRPDVFPEKQLYIVFQFADCGSDLESYQFENIYQAKSVLAQVAYSLAVAEATLQFEHRDLHWGNVLVRPTEEEDINFRLLGSNVQVPTFGVEASVIDFTMSRLTKDGCTVYTNLANDETLFQGQGDYQFDVYREMKKENKNNWEKFNPHTNVLWLHYLADKLVYSTSYQSQSSREDREGLRQFRRFMSEMLKYQSSSEMALEALFLNS